MTMKNFLSMGIAVWMLSFASAFAVSDGAALKAAMAGEWRSADDKARDAERRPFESLAFWGLKPGASILEVQPGGGWWTRIIAPYAARTGGRYAATAADLGNPLLSDAARKVRADFAARYSNENVYGKVELVNWGATAALLQQNSYDFILVSRAIHGWMRAEGALERNFTNLVGSLKPGGVLAVEQHRGNPGVQDPKAESGYITEAFVIEAARKAGLRFAGSSEVNANSKDTKDHPFGVWTLPPTRATVPYGSGKPPDPTFDRSKYDAIGESDRMTLRFVK
ncbi:MAG: class I SAM-dependent methyltransferase [Gammaproteobacteria bacterium]|nr:class I SAM-dependent methyltransferase [Gammaproteobacteria bacterium]